MRVLVVCNEQGRNEFLLCAPAPGCELEFVDELPDQFPHADMLVDLLYKAETTRTLQLKNSGISLVLVNDVLMDPMTDPSFIRINGWPGFLRNTLLEAVCNNGELRSLAESVLPCINRKVEWVNESTGFIGPRVLASVINEAFLTVEEGIASAQDVDVAMKLGTNYPYGPFEWANMTGFLNVYTLLNKRMSQHPHTQVSMLLKEKALAQ